MNDSTPSTPASTPAPRRRLSPRVLTACVAIPPVALVVWLGGDLFFVVVLALALAAMNELVVAARRAGTPLIAPVAYAGLVSFLLISWAHARHGHVRHWALDDATAHALEVKLLLLLPQLLLAWAVLSYATRRRASLVSVALTLLAFYYVGLFAFLVVLRALPAGLTLFWLALLGTWTGDTAAYYGGRAWGRVKLTPLSPGKTREGALIGLLGTVAICTLVAHFADLGWWHGLALGLLIGVAAPLGDLVESFWKRELGVKDLGTLLPGHGGVLDRCDSLLFAAPAVYSYALWQML